MRAAASAAAAAAPVSQQFTLAIVFLKQIINLSAIISTKCVRLQINRNNVSVGGRKR